ncbi:replicative DNA helicase, partial [bacterium]|nr:replicative DNA helicase [bacterium]
MTPDNAAMPERMPPQALEAEMAVLGAMLINPEAVGRAIEVIGEEQNLYSSGHRRIFRAMVTLFEKNQPVDLVTVTEELRRLKWLDDAGGPVYLTRLADSVATAANVEYYARIVLEKSVLRRLINSATQIATAAYDSDENAEVLLDQAEGLIFAIKEKRLRKTLVPLKQFIHDSFETVERLYREKRHITGAETGFKKLDEMTSGLQGGDLVIIGARPSVGKTAFALNIAQHLGIGLHQP